MAFVNDNIYRFINQAYPSHALNVYGLNAASTGRNVCLFSDTPTDVMQKWIVKVDGTGYRLHSPVNSDFVLDCSDGSLSYSYRNNAHLCSTSQTSTTDSQVEFQYIVDNVYRIFLPGKNLYLTATNTTTINGEPASSISSAAALTGGSGGHSNVYWAPFSSSSKQHWRVSPPVDGEGGSVPEPSDEGVGNGTIVVGQRPSTLDYNRACYGADFNRFHEDYASGNGTAQCTWHCYGRAFEVLGKTIQFSGSGALHGKYWYDRITNGEQSSVPKANSIVVWDDGGLYGHVGYVEKVDSNYVYVSEANWVPEYTMNVLDATDGQVKRFPKNSMNRGSYTFVGYVHLDI